MPQLRAAKFPLRLRWWKAASEMLAMMLVETNLSDKLHCLIDSFALTDLR